MKIINVILSVVITITMNIVVCFAGDESGFHGHLSFQNGYTGIRNRNIMGLPFGYNSSIDAYGTGKYKDVDITGRINVIYNSWDEFDIFDGYVKVKKDNTDFQGGNIRANFSQLSVLNKSFLGGMIHHQILRESSTPSDRVMDNLRMQLLRIPRAESINMEEVYSSDVESKPRFQKSDITIAFGQTERSIEINEKVPYQNGRLSPFPQFQQFMTAARVQVEPITAFWTGLGLYHFKDKSSSLNLGGVGTNTAIVPKENIVLSIDGGLFLSSDRIYTEGEFAYSKLDDNLFSEADTFIQDNAFRARSRYNHENIDIDIEYRRLGGDFQTIGNEMTRTVNNREGIYSVLRYRFPIDLNIELKVDRYQDNLNNRNLFTHTVTIMDGTVDFQIPFFSRPKFILNYRESRDATPTLPTGLIRSEGNITRSGNIIVQSSIGKTFISSSYSEVRFDDRFTYGVAFTENDFKNISWVVNILDRTIPRTDLRFQIERAHHRFTFRDQDVDRRRGQIQAKIRMIPNRLDLHISYIMAKNVDSTFILKEDRKEAGMNLRISDDSWLLFTLKNERMHYTPEDVLRDYNARSIETEFEKRF